MRVAVLVVLMAVAAMASVSVDRAEFDAFRATYGKLYASDAEHELRFQIFRENLQFIRKHNAEFEAGKHTYNVAVNKYADWTRSERSALRGYKKNENLQVPREYYKGLYTGVEGENLPSSVDWRDKNVVTDVKNQGDCGSCWSFSATAAIEGAHALSTGQLVSLSNQELIDCVMDGQYTCQTGGEMQDGFAYAIQNGMESWDDYPYCTCSGNGCQFNSNDVVATISGYQNVSSGSESALQSATANYPTISVAIDASHDSFQFYSSGVYNEPACSSTQLDHGVLVVGYGADDNNTPYWIVKNSWGTDWGQAGYIWMSRNKHNQCGIASDASFPTV